MLTQFEPEPDSDEEELDADEEDAEEDEDGYEEGSSSGKRRSLGSYGTPKKKRKLDVSGHFYVEDSLLTKSSERRETSVTHTVCGYKNTTCQEHGSVRARQGRCTFSQPCSNGQTTIYSGAYLCATLRPSSSTLVLTCPVMHAQARYTRTHIPIHHLTNLTDGVREVPFCIP